MSSNRDGTISYDDFILKMDSNIRNRYNALKEPVNNELFLKLNQCLEYSGETLYETLKRSDFDDSDTILMGDLIRIMKRIGLSNIEPHLHIILATGGADANAERIDIPSFAQQLTQEVNKRVKTKADVKKKFLRKLDSLIKSKGLSLFDFFMRLDVNQSSSVNKTEMKTGMQALGINITRDEFEAFWKALFRSKKSVHSSGDGKDSVNKKQRPAVQEICFNNMIKAFVQAGCIVLEKSTDKQDTLMSKYRQVLKKMTLTPEKAYKIYDEDDLRSVLKNQFVVISQALGMDFSEEELIKIF